MTIDLGAGGLPPTASNGRSRFRKAHCSREGGHWLKAFPVGEPKVAREPVGTARYSGLKSLDDGRGSRLSGKSGGTAEAPPS